MLGAASDAINYPIRQGISIPDSSSSRSIRSPIDLISLIAYPTSNIALPGHFDLDMATSKIRLDSFSLRTVSPSPASRRFNSSRVGQSSQGVKSAWQSTPCNVLALTPCLITTTHSICCGLRTLLIRYNPNRTAQIDAQSVRAPASIRQPTLASRMRTNRRASRSMDWERICYPHCSSIAAVYLNKLRLSNANRAPNLKPPQSQNRCYDWRARA